MSDWLKYFFGAFFQNKIARNAEKHNVGNSILGWFLALIFIFLALWGGHFLSFHISFSQAEQFHEFITSVFADEEFSFSVQDGIATGEIRINTFVNDYQQKYIVNGYQLIVDFRDTLNVYDDFSVVAESEAGAAASYEDYLDLPSALREKYTLSVRYTNNEIDVTLVENQAKYKEFLEILSDASNIRYDADVAKAYHDLDPNSDTYGAELYKLYVVNYYSECDISEQDSSVPTIKGYYDSLIANSDKYMALYRNSCQMSFVGKNVYSFAGYYSNLNGTIDATQLDASLIAKDFVEKCNSSGVGLYAVLYVMNLANTFPWSLILWLALTLALFIVCRVRKSAIGYFFLVSLQLIGSFIAISGVLTAIATLVLSLFLSQDATFAFSIICFLLVFAVRSILFIIIEATRKLKYRDGGEEHENEQS